MTLPSLLNFNVIDPPREPEEEIPIDEATGEENPNFIYDEQPEAKMEEEEEQLIDFVKKPPIVEEDIFSNVPARKMGKPTRSTSPQKVKRSRKPLTEEAKEMRRVALAKGRETRARNLAKKKAMLQQQQELDEEEQELKLENKQLDLEIQSVALDKKVKKVKKVMIADSSSEEEIQYVKKPKKKYASPPRSSITQEDVERAQLNTLLAYEKMRKDRKAEKKRVKDIEDQQSKIKQTMAQVNQSNGWGRHRGAGKYGSLLHGMGL